MESLRLAKFQMGGKDIRFLYLTSESKIYVSNTLCDTDTVLFLGADVLYGCKQDPKNFSRIHARYSKERMATKINPQGTKIEGILNNCGVWFYTIQGMFKVAFEYKDQLFQKDCITSLKDLWLMKMGENFLKESYTSTVLDRGPVRSVNVMNSSNEKVILPEASFTAVYMPSNEESFKDQQHDLPVSSVEQTFNDVKYYITKQSKRICDHQKYLFDKLNLLLDFFQQEYLRKKEPTPFPFEIIEQYVILSKEKETLIKFGNDFGMSEKSNIAMTVVAEWLGKEFYKMLGKINSKVDTFKEKHINCIDDLPPPDSVVYQLFPQCMIVLLANWMGLQDKAETCNQGQDLEETPKPPNKRTKLNLELSKSKIKPTKQIFSLIQLILEFTNNALISGVAHVVYSRLFHS